MNNKTFRLIQSNVSVLLYILLFAVLLVFVFIASRYAFSTGGDMFDRAFGETWLELMEKNYFHFNGRWGQAISNDFRFFEYRTATILFINLLLLSACFYFIKFFTDSKNAIILSITTTITFSFVVFNYYYHAIYLPTANSYTIGFSLSLICYGLILRMTQTKGKKKKNIYLLFAALIILLTSGLVELVSLSIMYVIGTTLLYYLLFEKKIKLRILLLFLTSVIGFLILFLSPGNNNRRDNAVDKDVTETVSQVVSSDSNQVQEFIRRNEGIIVDNFNLFNLILFCLALFIFLKISKKNYNLDAKKSSFIILFTIIYIIVPNVIGFLANYTGMAKIYNMHALHFVLGLIILAFIITNSLSNNKKFKNSNFNIIVYIIPLLIFSYAYTQKNNLGDFFKSISNNQLQECYIQEKARRYYLIENQSEIKRQNIPNFNNKYKDVITFNSFLNRRMPFSYEATFNNKKPVYSILTGVSPNTYYVLNSISRQNISPSKTIQEKDVYFIKDFNCVVFGNENINQDFDYIIKAHYKTPFNNLLKTIYGSYQEQKLDDKTYYKNKKLVGVDIPFNTYKLEIIINSNKAIVIDTSIKLDYSITQKFEKNNYFSIMN